MPILEKIVVLKLNDKRDTFTTVPKTMRDEVKRRIGSEFAANGSRDTIRGLSYAQERVYLPTLLGVQANDPTFPIKSRDFWADFTVTPTPEGIRLNIATTVSTTMVKRMKGGMEIEEEESIEIPVNWDDYVTYQFVMKSSRVAKTKEERINLDMYDFYLIDLSEENAKQVSDFELTDEADTLYVRLTLESKWAENEDKINWIIELLRDKKTSSTIESMQKIDKKMLLSKIKSETPKSFINACKSENLEFDALISKCISNRVLLKEGNDYFNKDENIGTDRTVVSWFKNPTNSAKVMAIKSRLQEIISSKRVLV